MGLLYLNPFGSEVSQAELDSERSDASAQWLIDPETGMPYIQEVDGPKSMLPPQQGFPTPFFWGGLLWQDGAPLRQSAKGWIANPAGMPQSGIHSVIITESDLGWANRMKVVQELPEHPKALVDRKLIYLPKSPRVVMPRWACRYAPNGQTGIRGSSIDFAYLHNVQNQDVLPLKAEIERVCARGAAVALIGYQAFSVTPQVDALTADFMAYLARYRTAGELHLDEAWTSYPLAWERTCGRGSGIPEIWAQAMWSCDELIAFILSWPKTQRAIRTPVSVPGSFFPVSSYLQDLKAAWDGSRKKRRLVRLPVTYRTGFLAK